MEKEKILIVEDEEDIRELLVYNLKKEGYRVEGVSSGEEALKKIKQSVVDLVVLDLMLPDVDGLEVCKILKNDSHTAHIPVVMLTAKGEESDIVLGLEFGADDYITKPFSPRVLLARIRAVLRRRQKDDQADPSVITVDDLQIHPSRYEVFVKGKPVKLTTTEFGILVCLAKRPGWVFTRYQIIDAVKGEDYIVTDRAVDVQIVSLRKKLGPLGDLIETVRGVGYRFKGRE
ncbi:response regulator receiver domain protein, CheY-like protein [Candidatus Vecturithrix granuli]|uniref:Response regulator receiver domain protein, CheY-like protein n=1 Tax=Vecturithrix granuli TaxID=1499967 RepID=A0A081BXZ5_VECG1|nr:response regulator receiver domain protein, CheY-like protein [Candidatus Vecturithrix granuli]